ncbi:MAG: hypothetical protein C3F18_08100 [Nitrosomonadales bacterium]|nr:MAG: hypothetical protein C3F18_08100 [Nitrosomonadales bacterium]
MLGNNPFFKPAQIPLCFAADDPVGSLDHSFPVHPENGSTKPSEYWEDQLHKKRPRKPIPTPSPGNSRKDDHQIDDYA